jgi:anaerobic dimethyl sulfoxide reductase subunit B (iron-sulfur subunit)
MSYAFTFDASACSGCKACQEACKDKNNLPVGMLWRRVVEVAGGEWHYTGTAWETSVFAYNLSIACNHCTHPKCAGVCPVDAYMVRPDGIVVINTSRCMGCNYCSWACPYGAPQYDSRQGIMTKCDLCHDRIDAGIPPSCVAACPLRVLDYKNLEELSMNTAGRNLWLLPGAEHPFPLPDYSRTEPHLSIKLHAGMSAPLEKAVSNLEEVLPPGTYPNSHRPASVSELPLVGFTLLVQMAAGMAIFSPMLSSVSLPVLLSIAILLVSGGLISFLHLGRKRNAWRSVIHLKKSWLSREILLSGFLGAAVLAATVTQLMQKIPPNPWPMALLGFGVVYCMSRVYLLRAVPAWNSWRTQVQFFLSAVVLGALGVNLAVPQPSWLLIAGAGLAVELVMIIVHQPFGGNNTSWLRLALLTVGIIGALVTATLNKVDQVWLVVPISLIILAAEIVGRMQFYLKRVPFPTPAVHPEA